MATRCRIFTDEPLAWSTVARHPQLLMHTKMMKILITSYHISPATLQDTPCCYKLYVTDTSPIIELIHKILFTNILIILTLYTHFFTRAHIPVLESLLLL